MSSQETRDHEPLAVPPLLGLNLRSVMPWYLDLSGLDVVMEVQCFAETWFGRDSRRPCCIRCRTPSAMMDVTFETRSASAIETLFSHRRNRQQRWLLWRSCNLPATALRDANTDSELNLLPQGYNRGFKDVHGMTPPRTRSRDRVCKST